MVKDSKTLNCFICEKPLSYEDRVRDGNTVEMLNKDGEVIRNTYYDSIYHIHKGTRICRNALIYTANRGNDIIIRGDEAIFKVWWNNSHSDCFEKRRKDKLLERRKRSNKNGKIKYLTQLNEKNIIDQKKEKNNKRTN